MKKYLPLAVVAVVLLSLLSVAVVPAAAASPKPLVVLSLSSHNDVADSIAPLGEVAETPDLPTSLSSLLKLYAEGEGLAGLDPARPWGAVVQLGSGLSSYAFVPVTDAERLSWELYSYIRSTEPVGDEIYEVVGTEPGKKLYVKPTADWLFVSDRPDVLKTVPTDPGELLGGLNKQYDIALRFELNNVPSEHGEKLLQMLDRQLGPVLRKVASEEALEVIGHAAFALQHVTLGWQQH